MITPRLRGEESPDTANFDLSQLEVAVANGHPSPHFQVYNSHREIFVRKLFVAYSPNCKLESAGYEIFRCCNRNSDATIEILLCIGGATETIPPIVIKFR
jgi:hypothetical protein